MKIERKIEAICDQNMFEDHIDIAKRFILFFDFTDHIPWSKANRIIICGPCWYLHEFKSDSQKKVRIDRIVLPRKYEYGFLSLSLTVLYRHVDYYSDRM